MKFGARIDSSDLDLTVTAVEAIPERVLLRREDRREEQKCCRETSERMKIPT
jgi:hypothetical protein